MESARVLRSENLFETLVTATHRVIRATARADQVHSDSRAGVPYEVEVLEEVLGAYWQAKADEQLARRRWEEWGNGEPREPALPALVMEESVAAQTAETAPLPPEVLSRLRFAQWLYRRGLLSEM